MRPSSLAAWLAEKFMKSEMGLFMNIILGIVGAALASAILSWFSITLGGWIGYLIAGFIGACVLIGIVRAFQESMIAQPAESLLKLRHATPAQ